MGHLETQTISISPWNTLSDKSIFSFTECLLAMSLEYIHSEGSMFGLQLAGSSVV